jgi:hypothetical protein
MRITTATVKLVGLQRAGLATSVSPAASSARAIFNYDGTVVNLSGLQHFWRSRFGSVGRAQAAPTAVSVLPLHADH